VPGEFDDARLALIANARNAQVACLEERLVAAIEFVGATELLEGFLRSIYACGEGAGHQQYALFAGDAGGAGLGDLAVSGRDERGFGVGAVFGVIGVRQAEDVARIL
jgi:hypothetical protein